MFERQSEKPLDAGEYACFLDDLAKAKSLVYLLTDNCGEIVLDKIVIRILQERYPRLDILVLVRGAAVANDADLPAAREVGLDRLVPVVGNGSDIARNRFAGPFVGSQESGGAGGFDSIQRAGEF